MKMPVLLVAIFMICAATAATPATAAPWSKLLRAGKAAASAADAARVGSKARAAVVAEQALDRATASTADERKRRSADPNNLMPKTPAEGDGFLWASKCVGVEMLAVAVVLFLPNVEHGDLSKHVESGKTPKSRAAFKANT